jgi:hypothetical protein
VPARSLRYHKICLIFILSLTIYWQVISLVKPDVVFLELCNLRTKLLVSDEKNIMEEYEKELTPAEIIASIKKVG